TIWPRDWSSDVCSSDLPTPSEIEKVLERSAYGLELHILPGEEALQGGGDGGPGGVERREAIVFVVAVLHHQRVGVLFQPVAGLEIGRASCRERVYDVCG